jgi:4-oxalocrotonate tautomerase
MPFVRIEMLKGRNAEQKQELVAVFTREMARIARCDLDDIQVVITEVDPSHWAVGGFFPDSDRERVLQSVDVE